MYFGLHEVVTVVIKVPLLCNTRESVSPLYLFVILQEYIAVILTVAKLDCKKGPHPQSHFCLMQYI